MVIFEARLGCHDNLILGKTPTVWKQRPDMTIAVDLHVKLHFNKPVLHGPRPFWLTKIDGLLVTDHKITGKPLMSVSAQEK